MAISIINEIALEVLCKSAHLNVLDEHMAFQLSLKKVCKISNQITNGHNSHNFPGF